MQIEEMTNEELIRYYQQISMEVTKNKNFQAVKKVGL